MSVKYVMILKNRSEKLVREEHAFVEALNMKSNSQIVTNLQRIKYKDLRAALDDVKNMSFAMGCHDNICRIWKY